MLINVILRNIVVTIFLLLCASCATEYKVIDHDSPYFTEAQHEQFYVIGCGDRLSIKVWGKENLNTDAIVRPDGKISVPLIGDIQVRGLRVEDLKEELDKRFSEYVFEPSVSVTVVDIKSLKFYVLGEVTRPGEFDLIVPTDILRAIAMAGGFTIYAKKD
ncbi:MAG: polysaccharide export protein, partial [Desulfobacterota bacterium]|nr:polysaccharide export protein [Thermodesulfobacteriota bacterium]